MRGVNKKIPVGAKHMVDEQKQGEDYLEIQIPNQEPAQAEEKVSQEKEAKPVEKKPIKPVKKTKKTTKKKTAKKAAKKKVAPAKKETKKKPAKKEAKPNNWLWIILLVIGLLVIGAVITLSLQPQESEDDEQRVAVLVNNEPIYTSEVEEIYSKLPPEMTAELTEEDILEQLIEQELLVQEAIANGLEVTDEELVEYLDELKAYFGMNDEQLNAALAAQDMTREEFEKSSRRQILVNDFINQTIYSQIEVAEEDVAARYEAEKELFAVPETATVKHILVTLETNETNESLRTRAEEIVDMLEEDFENFCDLVTEYTADPASIPTCGEYEVTISANYVEEFKTAALTMNVDEVAIVESQFGLHIMLKTAHEEAGYLSLEEVSADIEQVIKQEESSVLIAAYIAELRDKATIEKYPLNAEEEVVTAPLPVEEEEEQEEQLEAEVEETQPVREGNFGTCLSEEEAVLFGVSWSPDVTAQQELLGEALEAITYVDCDPQEGEAPASCEDIKVYPTWVIGEEKVLEGLQSLNSLARETGC